MESLMVRLRERECGGERGRDGGVWDKEKGEGI